MGGSGGKDSLEHRKDDTISITFRFLDSSRLQKIDSEVYNFYLRYPLPATYVDFGNIGTGSHDLIFNPFMKPGWDGGWHAYDPYVFTVEDSRFYNTTKPYSEVDYLLGSKAEQMINLVHTQNITRNWNAFFQYRLINSPGTYGNQNTNHNNYRFTSWYQSNNKRYQAFLLIVGSKLESAENAGIKNNADLDSNAFADRYNIPTNIGNAQIYSNVNNLFTLPELLCCANSMISLVLRIQWLPIRLLSLYFTQNSGSNKLSLTLPIIKDLMITILIPVIMSKI